MLEETKRKLESLIGKNESFATIDKGVVFIWYNDKTLGKVERRKSYRIAKALKIANKVAELDTVYLSYFSGTGFAYTSNKKVHVNLEYGKTIKGLAYTFIHEQCHCDNPTSGHGRRWRLSMEKYYPKEMITSTKASGIPWPNGISEAPKVRKIIILNDYQETRDI